MDGLEAAKREVEELGGKAVVARADVANFDEVEAAARTIEETLGPIDIWINNAMASVFAPVHELTAAEIRRVTEVTYLGVAYGTMVALRRMRERNRGTIVQIGSALAYRGIPLQAAYCAAKHAVQGFNDSLYSELIHDNSNIRLTMVNLPAMNTPQFDWVLSKLPRRGQPVPPVFQPEVAADAIVWAAYNHRRELNVGLPTSMAIIGNNFAPELGDRYLGKNGYDAQQTEEPEPPERPHNLWEPLPGDHGAHGRFDASAKSTSLHLLLNLHRGKVALAGACALLGLLFVRNLLDADRDLPGPQ